MTPKANTTTTHYTEVEALHLKVEGQEETIARLQAENERLRGDARRYRWLVDNRLARTGLRMDGSSEFRFNAVYGRARTFDELVDHWIEQSEGGDV